MKILIRIAIAVTAMAAIISCVREFDHDIPSFDGDKVTFIAEFPGIDTKAYLEGNKSYWENGDAITIHNGTKGFEFVTAVSGSEKVAEAEFTYQGGDFSAGEKVIAVYPSGVVKEADVESGAVKAYIPVRQNATPGTYDRNAALAVAWTDNDKIAFKNAVALVKFTVSSPDVNAVIFRGNDEEPVAGDVLVTMAENGSISGVVPQKTSVTGAEAEFCTEAGLYAEEGNALAMGQTYYLAIAPGTFEKGFAIELLIGGNRFKVKSLDKSYTVKPSKILNFGDFEYSDWDDSLVDSMDDVPSEEVDGWIYIRRPEELAALMIYGGQENARYRIANDLVMKNMPESVAERITDDVLFKGITIDGDGHKISDMSIPSARGIFSKVEDFTAFDINIENVSVGSAENLDNVAGTGVFIGQASGTVSLSGISINGSSAIAPCKVGGLAGAVYEGEASVSSCSVNGGTVATVWVENVSGQCGGFIGYVGRTDEGGNADRSKTVSVNIEYSSVAAVKVNAQVSSVSRPAGIFVGALNGYDWQESLSIGGSTSTAVLDVNQSYGAGEGFSSRYNNACRAEFVEAITNENLLGGQAYCRGTVVIDGTSFVPAWDGKRSVTPLSAVSEYDGWSSGTVIYSAEDLASLQGRTITSGNYYLLADVDLGGDGQDGQTGTLDSGRNMTSYGADDAVFRQIISISNLNGVKKEKISASQSDLTMSDNNTIYNCKVVMNTHTGSGAAFIQKTSGTTNHCNINFKRAYIYNHHDESIPEPTEFEEDNGAGNAYAGTLVASAGGTYNVSNVHAESGHVYAVCKIGGLIGLVSAKLTMTGCSVNDYLIENYEANVKNWYPIFMTGVTSLNLVVYANQWWYTHGECGGLIGMTFSTNVNVDKCSVTNTAIDCYGQPNKQVAANVYWEGGDPQKGDSPFTKGYTNVAGRHVNQFIGDIRTSKTSDVATISDYYVSGNTYFGEPAETGNTSNTLNNERRHHYKTSGKTYYYCNCVGQAYYVGVDVKVNVIIKTYEKHVADYAGTLTFNAIGESPVTITEASGDGNNVAWTGGDFSM